jgi:PIN domain nuclease of toxin-antitoxin system
VILLDTHVAIWWREDNPRLGQEARHLIATSGVVFVSAVSAWEVSLKVALGKLRIPGSFERMVEDAGFDKLPLTFRHAEAIATLPAHHRDPFDRMLVAQAQVERLTLLTADRQLQVYEIDIVMA